MINKIKVYQEKFKTQPLHELGWINLANWEYRLLLDLQAITASGVNCNYPVAVVRTKENSKLMNDVGGELEDVQNAINLFNASNKSKEFCYIEYTCKTFAIFKQARQVMQEQEQRANEEKQRIQALEPCEPCESVERGACKQGVQGVPLHEDLQAKLSLKL